MRRRKGRSEETVLETAARSKKQKKAPRVRIQVKRVGTHGVLVIVLWVLLLGSIAFGIYKNFTAIDTHTVHEVETVRYEIKDTTGVATFVEEFARAYYTWSAGADEVQRAQDLRVYMTEELVSVNSNMATYASISSSVSNVQIWSIEMQDEQYYKVLFSVTQQLSWKETEMEAQMVTQETTDDEGETMTQEVETQVEVEKERSRTARSTYVTCVYMDNSGDMVIVKSPTVQPDPARSDHVPAVITTDDSITVDQMQEIEIFLKTFFGLYPTITEVELPYYVKNNVMSPIHKEYEFVQLLDPVFTKGEGEQIKVSLYIEYVDAVTTAKQISQMDLTLEKDGNWFIIGCK